MILDNTITFDRGDSLTQFDQSKHKNRITSK